MPCTPRTSGRHGVISPSLTVCDGSTILRLLIGTIALPILTPICLTPGQEACRARWFLPAPEPDAAGSASLPTLGTKDSGLDSGLPIRRRQTPFCEAPTVLCMTL